MKFAHIALGIAISGALLAVLARAARSVREKVVGVGYQKYGNLIPSKGRRELESRLASLCFRVEWKEFASGPPLLEALNAGVIDVVVSAAAWKRTP